MSQKTYQTCLNCGNDRLPLEMMECKQCGQPLHSPALMSPRLYATPDSWQRDKARRRGFTVLAGAIALLVVIGLVLGVGALVRGHIPGVVSPAASAGPMVRVTIQIEDVYCATKQDGPLQDDQFYILAAFTGPGQNAGDQPDTKAQLSQSIDITNGQDLPLLPNPFPIYSALVPQNGSLHGGFAGFNDTQGLSWQNLPSWVPDITQGVESGLAKDGINGSNVDAVNNGSILSLAINTWYATANLDDSNAHQLGKAELSVPATGPATEEGTLLFQHNGGLFNIGAWDYTVKYQITRTPVAG